MDLRRAQFISFRDAIYSLLASRISSLSLIFFLSFILHNILRFVSILVFAFSSLSSGFHKHMSFFSQIFLFHPFTIWWRETLYLFMGLQSPLSNPQMTEKKIWSSGGIILTGKDRRTQRKIKLSDRHFVNHKTDMNSPCLREANGYPPDL